MEMENYRADTRTTARSEQSRIPDVGQAHAKLEKTVMELGERLDELVQRLLPVLRIPEPRPEKLIKVEPPPYSPDTCPLAQGLYNIQVQARRSLDLATDILHRLEI